MQEKLIAELREWKNKWYGGLTKAGVLVEFNEILSRHEAEQGEGLREAFEEVRKLHAYKMDRAFRNGAMAMYDEFTKHPTPTKAEKGGERG